MTKSVVIVELLRLDPELPTPATAHEGDAGVDLYAREDATLSARGERLLMPTGIAVALPVGYVGYVVPRSGLALKHGVTLVNSPGVIDCGYRGELKVVMVNLDPHSDYHIKRGDRVAQLVVQRIESVQWREVASLDLFDRGGGFGHSGR
jgi:dUTP pyrophosphatase